MSKTLKEILQESEKPSVSETLKALALSLQEEDDQRIASFAPSVEKIMTLITAVSDKVDALMAKPDPVFPQPKDFPTKMAMDKPDWYKEPEQDISWIPNITNTTRYDGDKTRALLQEVLDKLNEEKDEPEVIEPKTVNSAAVRSRRTTQWKRFDNYDLKNIIAQDGFVFFLPDSIIPNSETIRLNGGVSLLTSDYSISGNKITFKNDQTGSQIEVRAQTK